MVVGDCTIIYCVFSAESLLAVHSEPLTVTPIVTHRMFHRSDDFNGCVVSAEGSASGREIWLADLLKTLSEAHRFSVGVNFR